MMLLLYCISMSAQQRSESEAMQIAQEFFGKRGKSPQLSVVSNESLSAKMRKIDASAKSTTGIPSSMQQAFYVINDEANNRFVIVSADERMYKILGYSYNGCFDTETTPSALLEILEEYNGNYNSLLEDTRQMSSEQQESITYPEIEPLIKSKWGQSAPYYDQCPYDYATSNQHPCVTGCVATALAQVMNYYKYPSQAHGFHSYTTDFGTNLAINYDTLQLDWDKIKDTYVYYYDESGKMQQASERSLEEQSEVAKLMLACGVAVSMDYGVSSSGAKSKELCHALITHFGYNPNILYKEKGYFTDEEWDSLIIKELNARHPILYAGFNGWFGHQFILDGCNTAGMYHFNFGWSGSSDGYYRLTGSNRIRYASGQCMVYQITPEEYGEHEDFIVSKFELDKTSVNIGGKSNCNFSLTYSTIPFYGDYGIGIFDKEFNFLTSLKEDKGDSVTYKDFYNIPLTFDNTQFTDGNDYNICLYSKRQNATKPSIIRTINGKMLYYLAKVRDGKVILCPNGNEITAMTEGTYKVQADDENGNKQEWHVILRKYSSSDYDYRLYYIDPKVANDEKSSYYVNGEMNREGTEISCHTYFGGFGSKARIKNYSGSNYIVLSTDPLNQQMNIKDEWGSIEINDSDTISLSRYKNTIFTYVNPDSLKLVVNDNKAGSLSTNISPSMLFFINSMTVSGELNGDDVKTIRQMLGRGGLEYLDLSNSSITEGGEPYHSSYKTENNKVSSFMFDGFSYLKTLYLPKNTTDIGSYAMSDCKALSELHIPSSVKFIKDYSLRNCSALNLIYCSIRNIEQLKEYDSRWRTAGDIEAFDDVPDICVWHVNKGTKDKYTSQKWWKSSWTLIDDLGTLRGDSNNDGEVDVADVTCIISYIIETPQESFLFDASDMDGDGTVDIADLTLVIDAIMNPTVSEDNLMANDETITPPVEVQLVQNGNEYSLNMEKPSNYLAAQFDITVSEGQEVMAININEEKVNSHQVIFNKTGTNTYRVAVYSMSNKAFSNGDILHITMAGSDNPICIENGSVTDLNFKKHAMTFYNDTVTKIEGIKATSNPVVYMIDGRQVYKATSKKHPKEIYIINGKKTIK